MIIQEGKIANSLDIFMKKDRTTHLIDYYHYIDNKEMFNHVPYIYFRGYSGTNPTVLSWVKLDEKELDEDFDYIIGNALGYHPESVSYFNSTRRLDGLRSNRFAINVGGYRGEGLGFVTNRELLEDALLWCKKRYPEYQIEFDKVRDITVVRNFLEDKQTISMEELEYETIQVSKNLSCFLRI